MVKVILIVMSLANVRTGVVPADQCQALARAAIRDHVGDRAACIGLDGEMLYAVKDDGQPT